MLRAFVTVDTGATRLLDGRPLYHHTLDWLVRCGIMRMDVVLIDDTPHVPWDGAAPVRVTRHANEADALRATRVKGSFVVAKGDVVSLGDTLPPARGLVTAVVGQGASDHFVYVADGQGRLLSVQRDGQVPMHMLQGADEVRLRARVHGGVWLCASALRRRLVEEFDCVDVQRFVLNQTDNELSTDEVFLAVMPSVMVRVTDRPRYRAVRPDGPDALDYPEERIVEPDGPPDTLASEVMETVQRATKEGHVMEAFMELRALRFAYNSDDVTLACLMAPWLLHGVLPGKKEVREHLQSWTTALQALLPDVDDQAQFIDALADIGGTWRRWFTFEIQVLYSQDVLSGPAVERWHAQTDHVDLKRQSAPFLAVLEGSSESD